MKILMIGGTGTISRSITELLIERGWQVTLLNRGNRPLPEGALSLQADISDEAGVAAKLQGQSFDVVADFIAFRPGQVQRDIRLFKGLCRQYIFISSASAYQKPLSALPITESTPRYNPFWQYSRDKIACEQLLMEEYRSSGFPVTVVRPSHTYDKTNIPVALHGAKGSWPVLQRMLDGKPVLIHGDGTSLWTLTHSRDFAKGFAGLAGNPHAIGQAVHITSDETVTWNDVHQAWAAALGVPLNAVYVPTRLLAKAGAAHGYDFNGALWGDKAASVMFDNTKLKRLVPGFAATTRFDEGARESVAWYLGNPALQTADPDYDAFCDKVAAAMAAAEKMLGI